MVWSFFVRWIELQPKEKKNIEESRCTERNSEKRWKEQSSDSQEPPSFYFDSFWRLSYISAIGFCETLLHTLFVVSVYFILSLLTTICEEHVTANILGFTWSYDQTDYTLQLYSDWWDFLNSLCWSFTLFTQQRIRMNAKKQKACIVLVSSVCSSKSIPYPSFSPIMLTCMDSK